MKVSTVLAGRRIVRAGDTVTVQPRNSDGPTGERQTVTVTNVWQPQESRPVIGIRTNVGCFYADEIISDEGQV